MRHIFLWIWLLLSTTALGGAAYDELAAEHIPPLFEKVSRGLEEVNEETRPHEVKKLRKKLGQLKIYLDLFVYAYPYADSDPFLGLRKVADEGYGSMGRFKDQFDIQGIELAKFDEDTLTWSPGIRPDDVIYDEDTVDELRKPVLGFRDEFLAANFQAFYRSFLQHPGDQMIHREKKDLSRLFWGGEDAVPDPGLDGRQNLTVLLTGILGKATDSYDDFMDLGDLTIHENEEMFHDFRKRVRSVGKIMGFMPDVFLVDHLFRSLSNELKATSSAIGKVNDIITRWHLAVDEGEKKQAKRLRKEINEAFSILRESLDESDFYTTIEDAWFALNGRFLTQEIPGSLEELSLLTEGGFLQSVPWAWEKMDPAKTPGGVYWPVRWLKPGQSRYSFRNVRSKILKIVAGGGATIGADGYTRTYDEGRSVYPATKSIQVVLSPEGPVITDGHHTVLSAMYFRSETIPVEVVGDFRHLPMEEFWQVAAADGLVYLHGIGGDTVIPDQLLQLEDDPNRYLVAALAMKVVHGAGVSEVYGYSTPVWAKLNDGIPFIEFTFADLLYEAGISYHVEDPDIPLPEVAEQVRQVLWEYQEGEDLIGDGVYVFDQLRPLEEIDHEALFSTNQDGE